MVKQDWKYKLGKIIQVSFYLGVFLLILMMASLPTFFYMGIAPFINLGYFALPLIASELISRLLNFAEEEFITTSEMRVHIQKRLFLTVLASYLFPLILILTNNLAYGPMPGKMFGIGGLVILTPLSLAFVLYILKSIGKVSSELYKIFSKDVSDDFAFIQKLKKR